MFFCCPHCDIMIEVIELNCCIFRCGIYKSNGKQIDPHLSKDNCDKLVLNKEIYGCGKPFKVVKKEDGTMVCVECGYI